MTTTPDVIGAEFLAVELITAALDGDRARQAELLEGADHALVAGVLGQLGAALVAGYPNPYAELDKLRAIARADLDRKAQREGER